MAFLLSSYHLFGDKLKIGLLAGFFNREVAISSSSYYTADLDFAER